MSLFEHYRQYAGSRYWRRLPEPAVHDHPLSGTLHSMSPEDLKAQVHQKFPQIALAADHRHAKYWGDCPPDGAHSWLESLANALNDEMRGRVAAAVHLPLMQHIENALDSSEEVYRCVDVAFVENLYWQIGGERAAPYWALMPTRLRKLYLGFHPRPPVP